MAQQCQYTVKKKYIQLTTGIQLKQSQLYQVIL